MRLKLSTSPELFWSKLAPPDTNGCRHWTGSRFTDGYGALKSEDGRSLVKAHRKAWEFIHGHVPNGLSVCHHCDVRLCCEPTHLFVGSAADNNADMVAKGRARYPGPNNPARGERSGRRLHPERFPLGDSHPARLHPERMARGPNHGRHTKPERTARGDRQGLRLHPEARSSGEQNGRAVLTDVEVREIRDRYAAGGVSQEALADEYGVVQPHISRLVRGVQRGFS